MHCDKEEWYDYLTTHQTLSKLKEYFAEAPFDRDN